MEDEIFGPQLKTHIDHFEKPFKTRQANNFMAIEKRQVAGAMNT